MFGTQIRTSYNLEADFFFFARMVGLILTKLTFKSRDINFTHRVVGDSCTLGYAALYFGKEFITLREIVLPSSSSIYSTER